MTEYPSPVSLPALGKGGDGGTKAQDISEMEREQRQTPAMSVEYTEHGKTWKNNIQTTRNDSKQHEITIYNVEWV